MTPALPPALPDPRSFPEPGDAPAPLVALYDLAAASLSAESGARAADADAALRRTLAPMLATDGATLAALVAGAPSVAVARHLWRAIDALTVSAGMAGAGIALTVFAIPVVVVAAAEGPPPAATLSGILPQPDALAAILREHGALGGNRNFALADALVGAEAIDVQRLPEFLAWQRLAEATPDAAGHVPHALAPSPIPVGVGREAVSLRFVVGSALARSGIDPTADDAVGKWGLPFTRLLGRQIGTEGVPVLALARAPRRPLPALLQGRSAQREVGAQLFAGNALRRLRSAVGEPVAVLSAHRAPDAPGGGELRLSLSSPLEPADAEGFRCPLHPLDRVSDVAAMLVALLRDCRVADIRVLAGVHADRDPATGLRLLFKPDTIPAGELPIH